MYDHAEDPLNLVNLAEEHPERVEALSAAIARWLEKVNAAKLSAADSTEGLSKQELERLRSLGYIQ